MRPDVQIQGLPVDGEAMYVLNRVNALMRDGDAAQLSAAAAAIATLIDFAFTEYVSPHAPESVFSLYISGSKPDPIVVRRLNELTDVFLKLQHLLAIHRKAVDAAVLVRVGSLVKQKQRRLLAVALERLASRKAGKPVAHSVPIVLRAHPVLKVPPPLPFKVPPPLKAPTKATPPSVPAAKGLGPSLPVTKGAAPTLPISKSLPPTLPSVKGSAPSLPTIPSFPKAAPMLPPTLPVSDVAVFTAPAILGEIAETRKIHWQSIPLSRFKNSVFDLKSSESETGMILDVDLVDSHFVKTRTCLSPTASPSRVPTAASSPMSSAAALTIPSVLETRRIQQIEIFLNGRKGFAASDVVKLLRTGGEDAGSVVELLEAVMALFPTAEEKALLDPLPIRLKESPGFGLPKADTFLIDLLAIPEFKLATNFVIVLHTAGPAAEEIVEYFKKLSELFDALKASPDLVALLRLIGTLVVYLWNGKKTSFNGFSLDMISQLKKIVSFVDKEYSVLHCVVESFPVDGLDRVLKLIGPVQELTEFDFADLVLRADEVQKSVSVIQPERLHAQYYPALISRLSRFKIQMESDIFPGLAEEKLRATSSAGSVLRYFAESEKKNVNEFLANLNALRIDLAHARTQITKRKKLAKPTPAKT